MSELSVVFAAARKWRDELENYIIPDATDEDARGYQHESDRISDALEALQPITAYFTGDEEGPDRFGIIYDTEDEARESADENQLHAWRVPLVPDWSESELVHDPKEGKTDE